MKEKLVVFVLIVLIGGLSGVLFSRVVLPWLAGFPMLASINWVQQAKEGSTIINKTEKIVITENQALEEAIAKVRNTVIAIVSQRTEKIVGRKNVLLEEPETLAQGSGFIATSDGLIVTTKNIVPEESQQVWVLFNNSKQAQAEIIKREDEFGLVLLKIKESNLPVVSFVDEELKLGQRVFLVGARVGEADQINKFVDLSIVKELEPQLRVGFASQDIEGSPVFNVKGEVAGVNALDNNKQMGIISYSDIKELLK